MDRYLMEDIYDYISWSRFSQNYDKLVNEYCHAVTYEYETDDENLDEEEGFIAMTLADVYKNGPRDGDIQVDYPLFIFKGGPMMIRDRDFYCPEIRKFNYYHKPEKKFSIVCIPHNYWYTYPTMDHLRKVI